jgi:hypothetical protein
VLDLLRRKRHRLCLLMCFKGCFFVFGLIKYYVKIFFFCFVFFFFFFFFLFFFFFFLFGEEKTKEIKQEF